MRTLLRFVKSPQDRAAALELRRVIKAFNLQHYGRDVDGEDDPRMDGRTLACFANRTLAGTIDVHWGGDVGVDPAKLALHEVERHTRHAPLREIVVLDEPMIHPELRDEPIALELKEAAARFALRQRARFVFSACPPAEVPVHQALGFRAVGGPGANRVKSNLVPLVLDLADVNTLQQARSPLYDAARAVIDDGGFGRPTDADPEVAERAEDQLDQTAIWRQLFALQREARRTGAAFLSDIERSEIAGLMLGSHILQPRRGEPLIRQGERGRELYLLLSGEVAVQRAGRTVAFLGPGDVAGEIAFLLETERTSDVVAVTDDVRALRISAARLDEILDKEPHLGGRISLGIAKALCRKLLA